MQLITYADRLGGDLSGLHDLLRGELSGLFNGVHILPFFDPIDGSDAGFDPIDHTKVDPRLGDWQDVSDIAAGHTVLADLIVNHMSSRSPQFLNVKQHGEASGFWPLFLKKSDIFPAEQDSTSDVEKIYRPRPGEPFTAIELENGRRVEFWTTFSSGQIDINVEDPAGRAYIDSILSQFAAAGVREVRLDAAGYAIKRRGTSCFMLPETFDFIEELAGKAEGLGIDTLVEIHSHYQTQIAIAARVGRVYDFALPPLVLHSLYTSNSAACKRWLAIAPRNCVTVLDTHDGIGILDVGRDGERAGLLEDAEIDNLVETIHARTNGASRRASGHAASNLDVYQVNSTFYDALGRDDRDYLIARAIQFFAPGTPQVYYVGLLGGNNDLDLVDKTGVGRDINRHYYDREEIDKALEQSVVQNLMALIQLRNELPGFNGDFSLPSSDDDQLRMRWDSDEGSSELQINLPERDARIISTRNNTERRYRIGRTLQAI